MSDLEARVRALLEEIAVLTEDVKAARRERDSYRLAAHYSDEHLGIALDLIERLCDRLDELQGKPAAQPADPTAN